MLPRQLGHGENGDPIRRGIPGAFIERETRKTMLHAFSHKAAIFASLSQQKASKRLWNAFSNQSAFDDDRGFARHRLAEHERADC
ncbi:MAG: hypothetical protein ACK55I_23695, partial [bacterium]